MFFASFEVAGMTPPPDVAIRRLAAGLSDLPPGLRRLWRQARDRVFDIGLKQAAGRGVCAFALRSETVKIIGRLDARVAFTLYPRVPRRRRM
jgi:hypothetical protein